MVNLSLSGSLRTSYAQIFQILVQTGYFSHRFVRSKWSYRGVPDNCLTLSLKVVHLTSTVYLLRNEGFVIFEVLVLLSDHVIRDSDMNTCSYCRVFRACRLPVLRACIDF